MSNAARSPLIREPVTTQDDVEAGPRQVPQQQQPVTANRHFAALLGKNVTLKRREWSATCCSWCPMAAFCEIVLPMLVLALLWWAKSACTSNGQCKQPILAGWGGTMPQDHPVTVCKEGVQIRDKDGSLGISECNAWTKYFERPLPFIYVQSYLYWSGKKIALAVKDPADAPKIDGFRSWISERWFPDMNLTNIPCVQLEQDILGQFSSQKQPGHHQDPRNHSANTLPCDWTPGPHPGILPSFSNLTHPTIFSADDLQAYLDSPSYGEQGLFYASVVFNQIGGDGTLGAAGHWDYSIRMNVSAQTVPYTGIPTTRPLDMGLKPREAKMYLNRGFTSLQLLVDRYIIGTRQNKATAKDLLNANSLDVSKNETENIIAKLAEPLRYLPQSIEAVPMPVAGVIINGFYQLVSVAFPLVFIVGFLYTQKKVVNEMITEKESKVRESLRMLGVSSGAIIGSWYVTYATIFAVLCMIFAIVAGVEIFPLSSGTLIFMFFWLWCMSFLAFAWFMHSFFNNSRTGGIVTMMAMFCQWLVYGSQTKGQPAPFGTLLLMLPMPNAAFCAGLEMLAKFEAAQVGAIWENLFLPVNNASLGVILGAMIVDIFLWTILGWYLDQVLPKEFGIRQPLHFPFLSSYWLDRPRHQVLPAELVGEDDGSPARTVGHNTVEQVPDAIRSRTQASGTEVRTIGLRKEFSTPTGTKVAVEGLHLTMFEGQILALLGHNGAGKSTTIHMLTGMLAPSAGDAYIAGNSVITRMREIRRIIGVCPQHDILWMELTVLEHLKIFARLRGIAGNEVAQRADQMMQDVGLTEKALTRAGSLSGGQKRKLSLCLALMGEPRCIFLDEPTSGMDPFSRRSTWNIIRGIRENRVTVLTTHFMDEADILGDRIAIMAEGVLQCCGSSFFLKNRFGIGYRITCARKIGGQTLAAVTQDQGDNQLPRPEETVIQVIKRYIPQAELLTDVGAELSMRLPSAASGSFPDLFEELDSKLADLGLEHYGLSMVTLEEVFLRVASGGMAALEPGPVSSTYGIQPQHGQPSSPQPSTNPAPDQVAQMRFTMPDSPEMQTREASNGVHKGEIRVFARHLGSLYMKRARYGRRDCRSVACVVLLPVAFLAFGLWILQRLSDRHLPLLELNLKAQYKESTEIPYNWSGQHPWGPTLPGSSSYAQPVAEDVPIHLESGYFFGRNYSEGLPRAKTCEPQKCMFENNFCQKLHIWEAIEGTRKFGVDLGCYTDSKSCRASIQEVCGNGAQYCIQHCVESPGTPPRQICEQQCANLCTQTGNFTKMCDMLAFFTVAKLCPEECASIKDPDTCSPGAKCSQPENRYIANAPGILSMDVLLYQQGQGRVRQKCRYGAYLTTPKETVGDTVTILYNTSSPHAVPVFLNFISSAIKQTLSGQGSSISASNHPMPLARTEALDQVVSAIVNLMSTFVIIIAFSWIPAAIVAYVVRERETHHNCKHQQLISGVGLVAYWSANFLWDMCMYVAPLGLSILFIYTFNIDVFIKNGALWASFVTFLGYGLAIAPFSYLLSFLFSKHTTAQIICLVINFVTGLMLMITSYILSMIDSTKDVNSSLMWVYRLFPGFGLGHGLFQICTNSLLSDQAARAGVDVKLDLLSSDIAGKDVVSLYYAAPCYFALVILIDYLMHSPFAAAGKVWDPSGALVQEDNDDVDVAAEAQRVQTGGANDDIIRVVNLRKVYRTPEGSPKTAVHGLSFGLKRGDCFGFLGINGAGKTSTLNMLTGAILPSGGTAYLGGYDIVKEQWQVRRLLGYCPQHDALLDRLTVREHLKLFGRIKGIPRDTLGRFCDAMVKELSLDNHVDKLSMTLSGGNKRKLSLAISLMGSPPLVLLDEPSTGVDPAARRLMWDVIAAVSTGRKACSVMLTTHNMEEAEALCSRIGIMVGGRLRCIGSNQHLKARFGRGYLLEARIRSPSPEKITNAMESLALPKNVGYDGLVQVCRRLHHADRASLISEFCEDGYAIYEVLTREGTVSAAQFAEWWLVQDYVEALQSYLQDKFPGVHLLERHERSLRFSLPSAASLANIFRNLEGAQGELCLEEYGVSQTSLEQIFNDFAANQQEETGQVRGLFGAGRSTSGSGLELSVTGRSL